VSGPLLLMLSIVSSGLRRARCKGARRGRGSRSYLNVHGKQKGSKACLSASRWGGEEEKKVNACACCGSERLEGVR